MVTINELFRQEPKSVQVGVSLLFGCYYNHVPEIQDPGFVSQFIYDEDFASKVTCHIFYENIWDHRRRQIMFGVKFQDQWIMLCRNAGRELDDYSDRQIVNVEYYKLMVYYIKNEKARKESVVLVDGQGVDPATTEVEFKYYGFDVREPYKYGC